MIQSSNSAQIAKLNDQLRQTFQGGQVLLTQDIHHLPENIQYEIIQKVRSFNIFTEDNDPYGEHDFGAIKIGTKQVFWKIDYYDLDMQGHSPDPSNPHITKRVLTIMMAEKY